jgi:hypothetical protein
MIADRVISGLKIISLLSQADHNIPNCADHALVDLIVRDTVRSRSVMLFQMLSVVLYYLSADVGSSNVSGRWVHEVTTFLKNEMVEWRILKRYQQSRQRLAHRPVVSGASYCPKRLEQRSQEGSSEGRILMTLPLKSGCGRLEILYFGISSMLSSRSTRGKFFDPREEVEQGLGIVTQHVRGITLCKSSDI